MLFVFRSILIVSFIGLVILIAKNRLSNPDLRLQFLEDMERNKKRIRKFVLFVGRFGNKIGKEGIEIIKKNSSQFGKGLFLFLRDVKKAFEILKKRIVEQTKELREDMKTFELPLHKADFLERLNNESSSENALSLFPKKSVKAKAVKGFQVTKLHQESKTSEGELDIKILERKEESLLQIIAKNPQNPNFYKKLGKIYIQMGNKDDAKSCLEYALKLGAQDPEIRALLADIEKIVVH